MLNRKIETKESQIQGFANQSINHNQVRVLTDTGGAALNIFKVPLILCLVVTVQGYSGNWNT
jgi:hypothetical protein